MRGQEQVETFSLAVESSKHDGTTYMVTLTAQCSCPGYTYKRKCKHIVQTLDALEALVDGSES